LSRDDVLVREDVVGPWALEKHQRLRDYLLEYIKILKSQPWRRGYEYIDAFAGSGTARLRDQDVRIDGSPRVALGLPHPFTSHTFIESAPWRIEQLQRLQAEFPNRNIRIVEEDCNQFITRETTPRIRYRSQRRAFAFLDAFSTQVEYDTIHQIADTEAIEMLLHFPTMGLNRGELHNRIWVGSNGTVGDGMDRIWGNHDWYDLLYTRQPDLFGEAWDLKKRRTDAEFLSRLFVEERLRPLFKFVTDPIVIKNTHGADIYALIFAGHNETGARIADYVFRKKIEPATRMPAPATLPLELSF
jgi:three-Cys-motif partner protein